MVLPQRPHGPLRSYGRVRSRLVKPGSTDRLENRLPDLTIPAPGHERDQLFGRFENFVLEIGFGGGEHMVGQAKASPSTLYLGAEPFHNGIASAVRQIDEEGLENVWIHPADVRDLLPGLPDGMFRQIYILFPDPWPKSRHHKRRLIQGELIGDLHRLLQPGGRWRFATDWADYANWTLERVVRSGLFDWPVSSAEDWRVPPDDHLPTRYEQKRLGDCAPVFLDFIARKNAPPAS